MKKKKQIIICPGSINPDFVIHSEKPFMLSNKTMTFRGKSTISAGGKGRNQAIAAKKAGKKGTKVILVSSVGNDTLGKEAIGTLEKEKIITKYIKKSKKKETGKAIISLFKGGYEIVGLDLGANTDLTNKDVDKAKTEIKNSAILACQIENTKETTVYSLKLAKKFGCFTVLNPSIVPKDLKYVEEKMFPFVDLLVLNVQEAGQLLNKKIRLKKDIINAGMKFNSFGIKHVILTQGESGSTIFYKGKHKHVEAFKVRVVDTVAVGDNFIGALLGKLLGIVDNLSFEKLIETVRFATAAGALTVSKKGASESSPKRSEITRFLK